MPPKEQKNPLGPTGWTVARNVRELREARGMTYKDLADKLLELGRPIPVLGLSRLEKGERRADADDLMALALALRVNLSALLLPRDVEPNDEVQLTPERHQRAWVVRQWADGHFPMPKDVVESSVEELSPSSDELADWVRYARGDRQAELHPAMRAIRQLERRFELFIDDPGSLDSADGIKKMKRRVGDVGRRHGRVLIETRDAFAAANPEYADFPAPDEDKDLRASFE